MVKCEREKKVELHFWQEFCIADYHQHGITAAEESNQQFQVDQVQISDNMLLKR